jgi:hypothetical protein
MSNLNAIKDADFIREQGEKLAASVIYHADKDGNPVIDFHRFRGHGHPVGTLIEMDFQPEWVPSGPLGKVIFGNYGYLGFQDDMTGTLYNFQTGSNTCREMFRTNYFGGGHRKVIKLENTLAFGQGSDEAVIKFILDKGIHDAVMSFLTKRTKPSIGVVCWGPSQQDWDAHAWADAGLIPTGTLGGLPGRPRGKQYVHTHTYEIK